MADEQVVKRKGGRPKGSKNKPKPARRAERDPADTRDHLCCACGKVYKLQRGNFVTTHSPFYAKNNGFSCICYNCAQQFYDQYYNNCGDEKIALRRLAMKFDLYYSDKMADHAINHRTTGTTVPAQFFRLSALTQYSSKTFDTYLDETNYDNNTVITSIEDASQTESVTEDDLRRWGTGLQEDEYVFLRQKYQEWISRHECKTLAQEKLFQSISRAELVQMKAQQVGDTKTFNEATSTIQQLMGSLNVKPNQKNDAIGQELTYGQWIQKLEETRPVSDPAPEWKDVDNIGHYFRVWVLGTILNMFKLKNPYKHEYDKELAKFTASKPVYSMEDDTSEDIRQTIFGSVESSEGGG